MLNDAHICTWGVNSGAHPQHPHLQHPPGLSSCHNPSFLRDTGWDFAAALLAGSLPALEVREKTMGCYSKVFLL